MLPNCQHFAHCSKAGWAGLACSVWLRHASDRIDFGKVHQHAEDFNYHPTLKPVALMEHLVKLISFPDQVVLDPFMGSGSTGIACLQLQRRFVGVELDANYFAIAQRRLADQELVCQTSLL
jgi:DNA modification methylase